MSDESVPAGADDTRLARAPTGIDGFDAVVGGGLPVGRVTLLLGGPGAGKTVLALQTLCNAAASGRPGIFVGFEETPREMVENHAGFGWGIKTLMGDGLYPIEARVDDAFAQAGSFDIEGLLASVTAKVRATGAQWVVFDGLDALLGALSDASAALRELHRLKHWAAENDVACLLTAKPGNVLGRLGFMSFVADCVVELTHKLQAGVYVRRLRIVKFRGGSSSHAPTPFVIDGGGIAIAPRESIRLKHEVSEERVATGIERLDTLLGGGYIRGSGILVSGDPGTAKTTLAASLAVKASEAGEPVLFVSFDEAGLQIVRNMRSVGLDLQPFVDSGMLSVTGYRAAAASAEDHYMAIAKLMREREPQHLILDPISALARAGGKELAGDVAERLLDFAKARGITVLMTTLLDDASWVEEETQSHVSTIADTWINLSYRIVGGERNRALTIIKARGTAHSNQVRELKLGSDGIHVVDVYTAGGEVLMGTARIEREAEERIASSRRQAEFEAEQERLLATVNDTRERITTLQRELDSQRRQLELARESRTELERRRELRFRQVSESRYADRNERGEPL